MDTEPEYISVTLTTAAKNHDTKLELTKPGKPSHNPYMFCFHRSYRNVIYNKQTSKH